MSLASGTRLGPYEIFAALGAGGMGEVYRARDTRLDRTVAIKVLPAALAADSQFRERFDREARSISALDHPNICAVYDVGHDGGLDFIVMAFVEGETLAARLERGPLKLDDTLRYAMEIASALEQAHRAGIVHRDVKPGNVMLTTSGAGSTSAPQAKLLDFGLAKRAGPAAAGGFTAMPTTPAELTAAGAILGTFQYMAPEQLEGEDADARSDIFAFGAVVYEMVTGRKAFEARSRASLISAILRDEPLPLASDPRTRGLDRVIRRCLAKSPNDRWQTASDLLEALRWVRDGRGLEDPAVAPPVRSRIREPIAWAISFALAAFAVWLWMKPQASPAVVRLSIAMPAESPSSGTGVTFAPDGSTIVFAASRRDLTQLYRRRIDQHEAAPIRGTEGGEFPFFSPDGKWIGFFTPNAINKVPIEGGPPSTLVRIEGFRRGAAWGVDDTIVFAADGSPDLMRVPAAGGEPTVAVSAKLFPGATALRWPSWRPDGSALLFTVWSGALETSRVGAYATKSGQARIVGDGTAPWSLGTGDLLFGRSGSLWTVSMDWKSLTATSAPVPVLEGVTLNPGGSGVYGVAANGSLAYMSGNAGTDRLVAWITRDGQRQPLVDKPQAIINQRLSLNGRRVALQIAASDSTSDIWLYDIDTKVQSRVTFGGRNTNPVWTPDGRRIVYAHGDAAGVRNLYWAAADGTGVSERLSESPRTQLPFDVSPDGGTLIFGQLNDQGRTEFWTLPLVGDRKPRLYLQTVSSLRVDAGAADGNARFSPDGRWIAYQSNESGPIEVYVRPFPEPGGKRQISSGWGLAPVWSPAGKELFFQGAGTMMAVDVQTGASFAHGGPRQLFTYNNIFSDYSVAPDGRFALVVNAAPDASPDVLVVLNWADELKRRTSAAR
jgi:eukaryotic-like serine/threonine-protein kinase